MERKKEKQHQSEQSTSFASHRKALIDIPNLDSEEFSDLDKVNPS